MVHECMDEKFGQNLLNSSSVDITANMISLATISAKQNFILYFFKGVLVKINMIGTSNSAKSSVKMSFFM